MSTLNKIFYGPAGTGKTRASNIEAVKIVHNSKKLNFDFDFDNYENILKSFKEFAKLPKVPKITLNNLLKVQAKNADIKNIIKKTLSSDDIETLADGEYNKDIAEEKLLAYKEKFVSYPLIETVTFHPSYTYQDFVEGISVETAEKNQILYKPKDGVFKKICDRAIANSDYKYVLIIDEINRGDISSIFGELFTLLEDTKRMGEAEELNINLPYSKDDKTGNPKKLIVPKNLHVVATMNTVDKSIALIDVALRRRFEFIEVKPNYALLNNDLEGIDLGEMLKVINERISILKNEHYQIGHSYFLKVEDFEALKEVMNKNIIPLLQEYFYDDWQSICAVLNQSYSNPKNNFGIFSIKKANDEMFKKEYKELIEYNNKKIVTTRENFTQDDIKGIYE